MDEIKYAPVGKTTRIVATSRASIKIQDSYYTLEYQEERIIPDVIGVDLELERKILWNTVNDEVDRQIIETSRAVKAANAKR